MSSLAGSLIARPTRLLPTMGSGGLSRTTSAATAVGGGRVGGCRSLSGGCNPSPSKSVSKNAGLRRSTGIVSRLPLTSWVKNLVARSSTRKHPWWSKHPWWLSKDPWWLSKHPRWQASLVAEQVYPWWLSKHPWWS